MNLKDLDFTDLDKLVEQLEPYKNKPLLINGLVIRDRAHVTHYEDLGNGNTMIYIGPHKHQLDITVDEFDKLMNE